jgi:hypothetical protein
MVSVIDGDSQCVPPPPPVGVGCGLPAVVGVAPPLASVVGVATAPGVLVAGAGVDVFTGVAVAPVWS